MKLKEKREQFVEYVGTVTKEKSESELECKLNINGKQRSPLIFSQSARIKTKL